MICQLIEHMVSWQTMIKEMRKKVVLYFASIVNVHGPLGGQVGLLVEFAKCGTAYLGH